MDRMGFDEATLEPTYILRLGAPGKSAGLDIAGRLGLDPGLIEAARARMTSTERDVSQFLSELHGKLDSLDQERREIAARALTLSERKQAPPWTRCRSRSAPWPRSHTDYGGELIERLQH